MPPLLATLSLLLIAVPAVLRAQVAHDPFPYWGADPTLVNIPPTGLGPAASLLLDVITVAGAALALVARAGRRPPWPSLALLAVGAAPAAWHAFFADFRSIDDLRLASNWFAAFAGAVGIYHLCAEPRIARLAAASVVGFIVMLAAKGVLQVLVEHRITIQEYEAGRESFLASQGWRPNSLQARMFERRLYQAEATGWFGLANVYASFAAAASVTLAGWTYLAWREAQRPDPRMPGGWVGLLGLGAFASLGALVMAASKGGYGAALAGASMFALPWLASRRPNRAALLGGAAALAAVFIALLALPVRGLVGEHIGELSLLFRWFYIETAARIIMQEPLVGVGPAGFQQAYQLLKPALSPEEVSSPHSIFFDHAATLGVLGLAWSGLVLFWLYLAGTRLGTARADALEASNPRADLWLLIVIAAIPTLVSAWYEATITTPESALLRLLGLAGWVGVAYAALSLMVLTAAWRLPLAAGAVALGAHAQIEVTPIWAGASALFALTIAVAGGREARPADRNAGLMPAVAVALSAVALALFAYAPVQRWQRDLVVAAETVRPLADVRGRLGRLGQQGNTDSLQAIAAYLGRLLGEPPATRMQDLDRHLARLTVVTGDAAYDRLLAAAHRLPWSSGTDQAASRVKLGVAGAHHALGDRPEAAGRAAEEIARRIATSGQVTAGDWGWLGTVRAARAEWSGNEADLRRAAAAWERAAALDPHGLTFPLRLFEAYERLGDEDRARHWAARLLEIDTNLRLDPLKQLREEQRAAAVRALREP